jgi:hypothetical protein
VELGGKSGAKSGKGINKLKKEMEGGIGWVRVMSAQYTHR